MALAGRAGLRDGDDPPRGPAPCSPAAAPGPATMQAKTCDPDCERRLLADAARKLNPNSVTGQDYQGAAARPPGLADEEILVTVDEDQP